MKQTQLSYVALALAHKPAVATVSFKKLGCTKQDD